MLDDDGKLQRKLINKRVNAEKEDIGFNLTYDEIYILLDSANIKSSDWKVDGYHLARFGDKGDYVYGNCRFITRDENIAERKTSEAMLRASSENIKKADPVKRKEAVLNSPKWKSYLLKRKEDAELNNDIKDSLKHTSYKGDKNSQFGSSWYTNGEKNIKVKSGEVVPDGFYKGRKTKID